MEIEKLFIGNLNFEVTEDGVRELLSQYGTIVAIRLSRKKGHAVVEMSDRSEADAVIKNLDGKRFMERELRISYELSPKKAKSEAIKRYNKKSKSPADEKKDESSPRFSAEKKPEPSVKHTARNTDKTGSSRNDSTDGYYSQSFRKRAQNSSQVLSKNKSRNNIFERPDDFMKDEKGRDYRDIEKASSRSSAGNRNNFRSRNDENPGNRREDASGNRQNPGNSRGYGERNRRISSDDNEHRGAASHRKFTHNRRDDDENAGNRRNPEYKPSSGRPRTVSGNRSADSHRHGNSFRNSGRDTSRTDERRPSPDDSGRPSGRQQGNRPRTSSRNSDSRTASPRGASGNRHSGRYNSK